MEVDHNSTSVVLLWNTFHQINALPKSILGVREQFFLMKCFPELQLNILQLHEYEASLTASLQSGTAGLLATHQNRSKFVIFLCFVWNKNRNILGITIFNYSVSSLMSNLILWWNNRSRETKRASAKSISSETHTLLMQWGGCVQRQPH